MISWVARGLLDCAGFGWSWLLPGMFWNSALAEAAARVNSSGVDRRRAWLSGVRSDHWVAKNVKDCGKLSK